MTQVFISYSRKDLAFVERLSNDLQAAGLDVWYDLSGLDGGTRWGREIQNAIEESQCFVVVLSPNSVESEWVEKEFMYANSLKKRVIPLLFQPCKTPMWFINLHFIDVQGDNYDRNFWVILKALGVKPGETAVKPKPKQKPAAVEDTTTHRHPVSTRKIKFGPAWIIALVGLVALIAFAVWGLPPLAARLAPASSPTSTPTTAPTATPTLAPTQTPTSTPTISPSTTPTPTQTLVPSSTLTPTTGTVTGSVRWADKPFADVQVKLCTDWLYTCNGIEFTGVTQSDGNFTVAGVSPGEYQLITKYPGQEGESRYFTGENLFPLSIKISAGETVNVDRVSICRTDLFLYSPIVNGKSVQFSWKPYAGATNYHLKLIKPAGDDQWDTKGTNSYVNLESGSYQLIVFVFGPACTQGMVNFTVP
jgi:hypothetical protein